MQRYKRGLVNFAIVVGVLLVAMVAAAQESVAVTDPAVLTRMGFPADAKNVFQLVGDPVPSDFGGTTHSTPIGGKSFVGRENLAPGTWLWNGGAEGCCTNLSRVGTEQFADAELQLPTGVKLNQFRVWVSDTNASFNIDWFVFQACHPTAGPGTTVTTTIASGSSTGSAGVQSVVTPVGVGGITVNNRDCHLVFRVAFRDTVGLTFQRARAEWVRQVSPSPAVATFSDVPLSHPLNRFVEALAASGITGGCGAGLYCPDSAVTRGQMAVFLSSGLGLNWP